MTRSDSEPDSEPLASASAECSEPSEVPVSPRAVRGGTYLLTWTTYATWLPGDSRGFVGRAPDRGAHTIHNRPDTPNDHDMPALTSAARSRLASSPTLLSAAQAVAALESFREVADRHQLSLLAAAVMRTHVHLVVRSTDDDGARLLQLFKGVSSRRLSQRFGNARWWTRHGSRRLLTSEASIVGAVRYVLNQEYPLVMLDGARAGGGDRAG